MNETFWNSVMAYVIFALVTREWAIGQSNKTFKIYFRSVAIVFEL